jgi:hypothetical protein
MTPIQIKPNVPLRVALADPQGKYDFDFEQGTYETTAGQLLTLPRPAVVLLNAIDPQPGEEVIITRHWNGKMGSKSEWTVALSATSENARAKAEESSQDLTGVLQASIEQVQARKRAVADPTPIRRPARQAPAADQPRLFDRGTGTHGPAPAVAPIPAPAILPATARQRIGQIPANVAVKEILAFISSDPSTANWSDQARQDMASTVYIAAVKAGHVGLWERQS